MVVSNDSFDTEMR